MTQGNIRRDPVTQRWVIFSPEKFNTLIRQSKEIETDAYSAGETCPFCPGHEYSSEKEILRYNNKTFSDKGWSLRVFPARNPVLKIEEDVKYSGAGIYDAMQRLGAHEVIVETTKHAIHVDDLSNEEVRDIFSVYRDRILDLRKDGRFKYLLVFKNRGKEAGGTVNHNYSEIAAFPFVPATAELKLRHSDSYYNFKKRCVYCDVVAQETQQKERIVAENDDFIAFCPYASRFPFEMWIMPKEHSAFYSTITNEKALSLAAIYRQAIFRMRKALNSPAYNIVLHNSPVNCEDDYPGMSKYFHWHIEILPRITNITAITMGGGGYVNPTLPEDAAEFMRNIPV